MRTKLLAGLLSLSLLTGCASLSSNKRFSQRLEQLTSSQEHSEGSERLAVLLIGPRRTPFYWIYRQLIPALFNDSDPREYDAGEIGKLLYKEGYKAEDIVIMSSNINTNKLKKLKNSRGDYLFSQDNMYDWSRKDYSKLIQALKRNPPKELFFYINGHGTNKGGIYSFHRKIIRLVQPYDFLGYLFKGNISRKELIEDISSIYSEETPKVIIDTCYSGDIISEIQDKRIKVLTSDNNTVSWQKLLVSVLASDTLFSNQKSLEERMKGVGGKYCYHQVELVPRGSSYGRKEDYSCNNELPKFDNSRIKIEAYQQPMFFEPKQTQLVGKK